MQLFIIRFLILALLSRCPRLKRFLFGAIVILTYIVPTLVTYFNDFPAFMTGSAEVSRYFFRGFAQFEWYHIPFYTNLGSYSIGMITAFIYQDVKENKYNLATAKWFKTLWYLLYPVLLILLSSSYMIQTYEVERPSWGVAFYSAIFKNTWGLLIGITILGYQAQLRSYAKVLIGSKLCQGLGKLNYSYYIAHLTTTKFVFGNTMEPPFFNFTGVVRDLYLSVVIHIDRVKRGLNLYLF